MYDFRLESNKNPKLDECVKKIKKNFKRDPVKQNSLYSTNKQKKHTLFRLAIPLIPH